MLINVIINNNEIIFLIFSPGYRMRYLFFKQLLPLLNGKREHSALLKYQEGTFKKSVTAFF